MTEQPFVLAHLYKGWDVYQGHLVKTLAPLSPEQLDLRAAPNLRSTGVIARHIIGARANWCYYVLQEGGEEIIAFCEWDQSDQPAQSAAELVSGLESTWKVIEDALTRWATADLNETLRYVNEETGEEKVFTRQWVIWHLIEHDLHHGGELSFSLGMHGLSAIDL